MEKSVEAFTVKFAQSAAMTRKGRELIPGGYSRNSFNFGPHAVFVDKGEGAYL
jgi:glutamate-1-semialdehyde 2,1-aminomutase